MLLPIGLVEKLDAPGVPPICALTIEKITQVGPGTPGGEFLRRYWQPVAGLHQVTEENPTAHIRLLGEDLVLYRDKSGTVGLLDARCAHRRADRTFP